MMESSITIINPRHEKRTMGDGSKGGKWYGLYQCTCGKDFVASVYNVRNGATKSCGCLRSNVLKKRNFVHGETGSREHDIWRRMLNRCENKNCPDYDDWGGRGIRVCDRWKQDFESFLGDMGRAPTGCSIDRIDNNGHYEPSNCRWATNKEQARNRRSSRYLTIDGSVRTVAEWSEQSGVKASTISARLKNGWDAPRAVFTQTRK